MTANRLVTLVKDGARVERSVLLSLVFVQTHDVAASPKRHVLDLQRRRVVATDAFRAYDPIAPGPRQHLVANLLPWEYRAEGVKLIRKQGRSVGRVYRELDLTESAVRTRPGAERVTLRLPGWDVTG